MDTDRQTIADRIREIAMELDSPEARECQCSNMAALRAIADELDRIAVTIGGATQEDQSSLIRSWSD
jgi:hypothetical protein